MKSIYSISVLQRILDHFGVGTITYVTYFDYIGKQVWRHFIETTKGEYELYSFPTELQVYAKERIAQSPAGQRGHIIDYCHSFDRYHVLKQLAKKAPITQTQLAMDLQILKRQTILKIFRVYGTILQGRFSDGSVFCTYAKWSLIEKGRTLIESISTPKDEIDTVLDTLIDKNLAFKSFEVHGDVINFFFSKEYTFHFQADDHFDAIEIRLSTKKVDLRVCTEKKMYYLKEM